MKSILQMQEGKGYYAVDSKSGNKEKNKRIEEKKISDFL
jgi:hypothetical protein